MSMSDPYSFPPEFGDLLERFKLEGPFEIGPFESAKAVNNLRFRLYRYKHALYERSKMSLDREPDQVSYELHQIFEVIQLLAREHDGAWWMLFEPISYFYEKRKAQWDSQ